MTKAHLAAQSRARLDERFKEIGPAVRLAPPVRGWIKAVRQALGMSTTQLARRLGVKQPSVVGLEQSEAKGSIEFATPRRRGARLYDWYTRLSQTNLSRLRRAPIEHSMLLEDQHTADRDAEARLDETVRETNPRLFWD